MAAPMTRNDARVDFRLPSKAKEIIEEAAALSGQSLSDFAVSTLLERANTLLHNNRTRVLSDRDAKLFIQMLDSDAEPNAELRAAAAWYKEQHDSPVGG